MLECKFCESEMERISEWTVNNPYSLIAPAFKAYFVCENPKCKAEFDSEIEKWVAPDIFHMERKNDVPIASEELAIA